MLDFIISLLSFGRVFGSGDRMFTAKQKEDITMSTTTRINVVMKTVIRRLGTFLIVFFAGVLLASPAAADNLLGKTLSWDYYAHGGLYQSGNSFIVDGVGVEGNFAGYFDIYVDDASITFDYTPSGNSRWTEFRFFSLYPIINNGIAINLLSESRFTSVSINPETNMVGFDTNRFSFTDNQIQVDWANLAFNSNTIVKLDVIDPPQASPNPPPCCFSVLVLWDWQGSEEECVSRINV
jgi:hypothetical protein